MALAGRKMNAETSLVVMCCKFVGGTLFYSQVGGYWTDSDSWPSLQSTDRIVVCATDVNHPTIPIELQHKVGVVQLRDFLLLNGSRDQVYAKSGSDTTHDLACRTLARNHALVMRYHHSGPHETFYVASIPTGMCPAINRAVAERLNGYVPPVAKSELTRLLRVLPYHCHDLMQYPDYSHERVIFQNIVAAAKRQCYCDFVLPEFEMRSMDPEIEMEIRLNVVPIILSNLRDKTSRLTHEEILVQNFTSLCELVGGPGILLDMVYTSLPR